MSPHLRFCDIQFPCEIFFHVGKYMVFRTTFSSVSANAVKNKSSLNDNVGLCTCFFSISEIMFTYCFFLPFYMYLSPHLKTNCFKKIRIIKSNQQNFHSFTHLPIQERYLPRRINSQIRVERAVCVAIVENCLSRPPELHTAESKEITN